MEAMVGKKKASALKLKKFKAEFKKNTPLFTMLVPGFILTIVFSYLPIFGIIIAFKRFNPQLGIFGSPWCGLKNFQFLLNSSDTWIILRNTLGYNFIFIFAGLFLNVSLAIVLSLIQNKLVSKFYQTVLILPHFLSYVIVSYIVYAFLNVENGFLNKTILPLLGIDPINWYVTIKPWPYILTVVHFWKAVGYGSIVYLAAIAGIDTQMYEAAEIDGANRFQQIIHITLPSLKSIITIMTIMEIGKIFNADFGLFYQVPMNSGTLYPATNVINTFVYNTLGQGGVSGIGMSSAASFFQSVVGFVLVITTNAIVKKVDNENAMF